MASRVSVMKELHGLLRNADKLFDGQVEIVLKDEENEAVLMDGDEEEEDNVDVLKFFMTVTPNGGLYKGARFKFKVIVELMYYPDHPPTVNCLNNVYHPNINYFDSDGGDVCVSLLGDDWTPEVGLDGCVMAILFLFYNPQIDDALSPVDVGFGDWEEFVENVPKSLRGEEIGGYPFDRLIGIDENKDKNIGVLETANVLGNENNIFNTADAAVVNENNEGLEAAGVIVEDEEREPKAGSSNVHSVDENSKENDMSESEHLDNCTETVGQSQSVLQNIQPCDISRSVGQTTDQFPAGFHGRLKNDQSHESSESSWPCENVQNAATSRSERVNQSDVTSDTPDPKDDPLLFLTNHNDCARDDHENCSRFRIWCMKLKERFCVFRNRIRNRS